MPFFLVLLLFFLYSLFMKKYIFIIFVLSIILSSCSAGTGSFSDRQVKEMESRISKLEADVLNIKLNPGKNLIKEDISVEEKEIIEDKSENEEVKKEIEIKKPEPKTFEIVEPKEGEALDKEPITFTGIVDSSATKITVKYTGIDTTDDYTLKNFKEGDESFWYKASPSFGNLTKGKNTYEFRAEFNDGDIVVLEPIVINYK